jgi:hypothetical protein
MLNLGIAAETKRIYNRANLSYNAAPVAGSLVALYSEGGNHEHPPSFRLES